MNCGLIPQHNILLRSHFICSSSLKPCNMEKIKALIVDDQTLIRDTWANFLRQDSRFDSVEATGDGIEAINFIRDKKPDLLLLDINMGPLDGFEVLQNSKKHSPGTRVIIVSLYSQVNYVKKMMKFGASGYVTKNSHVDEFVKAISEVLSGKTYICQEIKDILAQQTMNGDNPGNKVNQLTSREIEIIRYLKEGLSSKAIGEKLFITSKTVEVHRYKILKKLGLRNSVALVEYLNKYGI